MERLFAAGNPCTFGQLNRYDTPSFFHTYFLGAARPDVVEVTYSALPWRLDDFRWPRGLLAVANLTQDLNVTVLLQGSPDGAHWATLARAVGKFGVPGSFRAEGLGQPEAAFLRLAVDKHQDWDVHPALHHPRGYMVHSTMRVEGLVPV